MEIRYFSGDTIVELGDVVHYRSGFTFWKKSIGFVSYLPGVSELDNEMEYDQVKLLGVSGDDGTFRGVWIEPSDMKVRKSIEFVRRLSE